MVCEKDMFIVKTKCGPYFKHLNFKYSLNVLNINCTLGRTVA